MLKNNQVRYIICFVLISFFANTLLWAKNVHSCIVIINTLDNDILRENYTLDCRIFDVIAEAHPCMDDGTFLVDIDFGFENVGNEGFSVFGNGNNYGTFSYEEEFITLGPLQGDGQTVYEFVVKDNQNNSCQDFVELEPIDCGIGGDCRIFDVIAEAHPCMDDGTFLVDIDFGFENVGNEGFSVFGNGNNYGTFSYEEEFITLGPLQGDGQTVYEFVVKDNQNNSCQDFVELEPIDCGIGNDCRIFDVIAEAHPCMDDGTFLVDIDFGFENVGDEGFSVFGNGNNYGTFSYEEEFITLGPLQGDGQTVYEFVVKDNQNNSCQDFVELEAVDCFNNNDCSVFNLATDSLICQSNESFSFTIAFETENPNNAFFDVFLNDEYFGFYALDDLPLSLDEVPINEDNSYIFRICINDHPNCCESFFFALPPGFCNGFNVWPGDANVDNQVSHFDVLSIGLAFEAIGPERLDNSIVWEAMPAEDWSSSFDSGINYKHADCDGNGIVNETDLTAIATNYGLTHGEVDSFIPATADENDPALLFEIPETGELPNNIPFSIPIQLGTDAQAVENIYGIAFTIAFDPNVIDPTTVAIEYPTSWMGENQVNLLTFDKTFAAEGLIHLAISRNDQNNVSGYGTVAFFVGMVDDILGLGVADIVIKKVKAIRFDETIIPLQIPPTASIKVITSVDESLPLNMLKIFPNPTSDEVFLQHHFQTAVTGISLMDTNGRILRQFPTDLYRFSIKDYDAGLYWIKIETEEGVIYEKIVVVKR